MPSIPELVIIDLFNTLVDRIKQSQPVSTAGKPLSGGFIYSQLLLGMPIDPLDYQNPWSPIGAASAGDQPQQAAGVPATSTPGAPDPKLLASIEAAFKTSQLCNIMLQVTDDGSYLQYPIGRHLAFCYGGILGAMQPLPVPPLAANVQASIDAATKLLYTMDTTDPANPVIAGPSPLYARYLKASQAYSNAKGAYAQNQATTLANPATANMWPQLSAPYQTAVNNAWDLWKAAGADKVEPALAIIESQGINLQAAQIAKAKKLMDVWSLGLAGVPTDIPYSYVDPSQWCNPDADDIGFEQLVIKRTSEDHSASTVTDNNRRMYWNNEQSTFRQNGSTGFMGLSGSENSSSADQHAASGDASAYKFQQINSDAFSDLEIDLEWGLVTIYRPWLISDLFYMNNWYIQGEPANCVSDGTIQGQLRTVAATPMLPMIPQQMLIVRNVSVKSSKWGDFGDTLNQAYGTGQASTDASQTSFGAQTGVSGAGSIALGGISFGGGMSSTDNKAKGQRSGFSTNTALTNRGANFDGTTLSISGAQVIAFVSNIVPATPSIADPALPKPKSTQGGVTIPAGASNPVTPS